MESISKLTHGVVWPQTCDIGDIYNYVSLQCTFSAGWRGAAFILMMDPNTELGVTLYFNLEIWPIKYNLAEYFFKVYVSKKDFTLNS